MHYSSFFSLFFFFKLNRDKCISVRFWCVLVRSCCVPLQFCAEKMQPVLLCFSASGTHWNCKH
ncbi:unnamed protein product [Staurois parvus]|uniref:Secreted protein n=1 Tax=Staurois parvus TaxID=386267 RepID=A0ABN9H3H7_9NEOB|nr:unnamed protein product [Staurois parvus]